MTWLFHKSPTRTVFRASAPDGIWQVTRDGVLSSDYPTRSDAIRGACLAACETEARGGAAQVLLAPDDTILAHHEPQFDASPDSVQPNFTAPRHR